MTTKIRNKKTTIFDEIRNKKTTMYEEIMQNKTSITNTFISSWLDDHRAELEDLADYLFCHPETAYQEHLSSAKLAAYLKGQGFVIEENVAGIPTAFSATWGSGKPVIGFLAEYDALPEIGHACGHNLLGAGVVGAACALKAYYTCYPDSFSLQEPIDNLIKQPPAHLISSDSPDSCSSQDSLDSLSGQVSSNPISTEALNSCPTPISSGILTGQASATSASPEIGDDHAAQSPTIIVFGCPAEEVMSGKIVMDKAGVFDHLDAAVTWHPFDRNRISNDIWQAQDIKNYTFHGVSAHASKAPEAGRSALDAAELMNIGVNYLREHVPGDVRMHYAYLDNGIPANVVPDTAKTNYFIRASRRDRCEDASRRVDDCARGAALMTGTSVDIELVKSCKEMKVNRPLAEIYYEAMTRIPTPEYTEEEIRFALDLCRQEGISYHPDLTNTTDTHQLSGKDEISANSTYLTSPDSSLLQNSSDHSNSQDVCTTEESSSEKARSEEAPTNNLTSSKRQKTEERNYRGLFSSLEPLEPAPVPIAIGTDASEVSHRVPLITISAATMCKGTALHTKAAAAQAGMSIGRKGMLYAARCMAEGTKLLLEKSQALEQVWAYHHSK